MQSGREAENTRWELPEKFRTPEALAAADQEQKRLASAMALPFGAPLSPQEMERARAAQRAEHLRKTLMTVPKADKKTITDLRHQLAEAYATTGRYDLAVELEPDPAYAKEYNRILEAVLRDDDEWCECGDTRGSGSFADITVPSQVVKAEIFSMKHGKPAYLIGCAKCPTLNVVPQMPEVLQQQRAHRARAQQLVGNMSPKDAEATLQRAGHTTARLLKS